MDPRLTPQSRLHGQSIFLSASVPTPERSEEYKRIPEAPVQIEQAVVCIARAIFIEGGTLVFGAHPSISPLVARVIDHYYLPAPAEELPRKDEPEKKTDQIEWKNPSLVIYQSHLWEPTWAQATENLARHPLVRVEWVEGEPGETVSTEIKDRPQAPRSMERMRRAMIKETSPVAMITIGGMKGVLDEARIFAELRPEQPILTFATTGGAAAMLPDEPGLAQRIAVVDRHAEDLVRSFWEQANALRDEKTEKSEKQEREFYIPYAFIAQEVVEHIVERLRSDDRLRSPEF